MVRVGLLTSHKEKEGTGIGMKGKEGGRGKVFSDGRVGQLSLGIVKNVSEMRNNKSGRDAKYRILAMVRSKCCQSICITDKLFE